MGPVLTLLLIAVAVFFGVFIVFAAKERTEYSKDAKDLFVALGQSKSVSNCTVKKMDNVELGIMIGAACAYANEKKSGVPSSVTKICSKYNDKVEKISKNCGWETHSGDTSNHENYYN